MSKVLIWILVVGGLAGLFFFIKSSQKTLDVMKFYDGNDGYSLSIPTGNNSTCIWTYAGGNAMVPGSETTRARTATEKHIIYMRDLYDWAVTCVDDFGNQYKGVFPKK